jgi:hypothetical protein
MNHEEIIEGLKQKIRVLIEEAGIKGISQISIIRKINENDFDVAEALYFMKINKEINVKKVEILVRDDGGLIFTDVFISNKVKQAGEKNE